VNDVKYQSNHELRTETKRLQKLQKKIMINWEKWFIIKTT
jgi:hypothetical protein